VDSGTPSIGLAAPAAAARAGLRGTLEAMLELCKVRLSLLVLMTTAVGFVLACREAIEWGRLAWTLLGTALAAFGVSALNQVIEVHRDARMERTRRRPLPSGTIGLRTARLLGLGATVAGPLVLALLVNPQSAALAALCACVYLLLYTPLKARTPLNTLVGAVCGAIPPMIGWVAVDGRLEGGAWVLGAILFIWQIPHFLSLAWLYREDYRRGGFRMLSLDDEDGRRTAQAVLLYGMTLVPVSVTLSLIGLTGGAYALAALLLGLALLGVVGQFYRARSSAAARAVFVASVIYLPLLLTFMVVDRGQP
jgi:protoheme IX farnesyltransferase